VLTVTRQFELSYAHHLPDYYGKCKEQHGHNALVEVTIAGALAEAGEADIRRTREGGTVGMLMDFADLKRIFDEEVMRYIDHRDVNETLGRGYYWNGVELEREIAEGDEDARTIRRRVFRPNVPRRGAVVGTESGVPAAGWV
jgi:6-pyruvoyl tetrahydropterin synthase/QueD family protein